jgi:hypothetical protein
MPEIEGPKEGARGRIESTHLEFSYSTVGSRAFGNIYRTFYCRLQVCLEIRGFASSLRHGHRTLIGGGTVGTVLGSILLWEEVHKHLRGHH